VGGDGIGHSRMRSVGGGRRKVDGAVGSTWGRGGGDIVEGGGDGGWWVADVKRGWGCGGDGEGKVGGGRWSGRGGTRE